MWVARLPVHGLADCSRLRRPHPLRKIVPDTILRPSTECGEVIPVLSKWQCASGRNLWGKAGKTVETGEDYDLVVIGGGISGLAAAYFYRKHAGPSGSHPHSG